MARKKTAPVPQDQMSESPVSTITRKHAFQFRTDEDDQANIAQIQEAYGLATQVQAVKLALHFFARSSLPKIPKK